MSTLRKLGIYIIGFILISIITDALLPANYQPSAKILVGCVGLYQKIIRPIIKKHCKCRYEPTCSDYSVIALTRYGTYTGGWLTLKRVMSCRKNIPLRTYDPVPSKTLSTEPFR